MRTVLFLATLTLAAAAAPAQQPAPTPARPGAGEQKPPTGEEAPPPEQKVGEAPTVPAGQTAGEAAAAVPDTGVITKVNVQGNRRVESDAIRAAIPLKPGDTFDRDKLKAALIAVWRMGYFNDVKLDVSRAKPPLTGYVLTVLVSEHAKITVKEVRFVGNRAASASMLKDAMLTQEGSPFSFLTGAGTYREDAFQRDEIVLQGLYFDMGYIYVKFGKPAIELSPDKRYIFITMTIEEGDPFDVGKIDVSGDLLRPKQELLAMIETRPGDRFSKTRLQNEINQKRGTSDDKMVLEVSVKEKLTGTFQVGFGFAGGENFFGQAQLAQNNLFGYGHTASLSLQLSSVRQLFQLSYLDPYVLDSQWTGSIDLYRSELAYTGFNRGANGGSLTAGYDFSNFAPWLEDFRVFLTYTLENVKVQAAVGTQDVLANQFLSGLTSSIRISFNYDKRDNRLFPTSGHLESASAEFASSLLGSENLFQRYRFIERFYRPLWLGMVFKTNISIGYIRATDPVNHPVAISEKFFEGGINSIRGYTLRSISPTLKIATVSEPNAGIIDLPVGGNKELITNWEVEFPLLGSAGLRGVGFFDAGNVFSEQENFFQSSQRNGTLPLGLFLSLGFGLRWFSPLGPLRFEVGFPLTRRPIDEAYLFEFTIGNFF